MVEHDLNKIDDGGSKPSPATSPKKRGRFIWNEALGDATCPYMYRWILDFGRWGSLRIHHWVRGDDPRARHDHPQSFITVVLAGSYTDDTPQGMERLSFGSVRYRKAEHIHTVITTGCWTLLYFWPKRRDWGFWYPNKSGTLRWWKANRWHIEHGAAPCE